MRKKALRKSIVREIRNSKARFFSILLIILLGVCFYAGIKATGPDMIDTADTYYQKNRLMDVKVMSPLGLEKEDSDVIKKNKQVLASEASYTLDLTESKENQVIRVMSYDLDNENRLNQPRLEAGRLPIKSGEIALDDRSRELDKYKIGDTITFNKAKEDELGLKTYKVVGFVHSPMYIDRVSRGNTNVGKGSVDYFGIIPSDDFKLDVYTEIYVRFKDTSTEPSYSKTYKETLKREEKNLKNSLSERPSVRSDKIKKEAYRELKDGESQLNSAETQLRAGKTSLDTSKQALESQKDEMNQAESMGYSVLPEQKEQLNQAEKRLSEESETLVSKTKELENKKKELVDRRKEIDDLKTPDYLYLTRDENPAYSEYEDNADRISSIATVFPVFFFMIAALICLTTMTRMVDEKRGEIGTLKALGYTNWEISQKYIVYATLASMIGSGIGLVLGYYLFPSVIFNAYGSMYNLPPVIITYYLSYSIQSVVVALLCTLLSALIVLRVDLVSTPAVLMRPKAPKPGKRILLERMPWLWSKFNFNQKVTARNLFRYKQRMLMTVLGIAGCMAMIITGFGLKDSIGDIVDIQFSDIWHYDATVTYNPDATNEENKKYETERNRLKMYEEHLLLSQKNVEVKKAGYTKQDVVIDTPKNISILENFISFKDRKTQTNFKLDDSGVIINEKMSNLFEVKVGDELEIKDGNNHTFKVKVSQIAENYAMHFMYMTPTYYEKIFSEQPEYNVELLKFNQDMNEKEEEQVAEQLMATKRAINVTFTSQIGKAMDDTMDSLNIVVWVLIVSAALLAFIVLYNLTNINISERIRELSTIKVLGFYNKEVTMYVYRENNVLTILGILLGCVLGKLLHGFVLTTAEVDMMMFPPDIHLISYLYSALLTILFSLVVMFFMHRKLTKVDMIEALKSTE